MDATDHKAITVVVDSELQTVVPSFIKAWKAQAEKLRRALEVNDYTSIRTGGHDMKGIGKACGFDVITFLGHNLEEAGEAKVREKVRENLDQLSSYLQSIEVIYV